MPRDEFTFVNAGTPGELSQVDVLKDGRAIGRILHELGSPHVGDLPIPQGPDLDSAQCGSSLHLPRRTQEMDPGDAVASRFRRRGLQSLRSPVPGSL